MYEPYAEAAAKYQPERVRTLFVQESPPYARERHFYFTGVRAHDGLWLNLMRFLFRDEFGDDTPAERVRKGDWLARFRDGGYFMIDAVHEPIAKLTQDDRIVRIAAAAPGRIKEAAAFAPDHVVLIKRAVFDGLHAPFLAAGLPVANDAPVPYPGRGQQARFFRAMEALAAAGVVG